MNAMNALANYCPLLMSSNLETSGDFMFTFYNN